MEGKKLAEQKKKIAGHAKKFGFTVFSATSEVSPTNRSRVQPALVM